MKAIPFLVMLYLFSSCSGQNREKQLRAELNRQIETLVKASEDSSTCVGRHQTLIRFISENCGRLVLLSRDIENSGTTLQEANDFFFGSVTLEGLNKSGLQPLTERMPPEKRTLVILQNELWLLNASVQDCGAGELPLHAAQEEQS